MWEKSKETTKCEKKTLICDIETAHYEDRTVKCDKRTFICDIETAQCDDGTVKCEKKKSKGTIKCEKKTITCDVGTAQCEDETVKCEKKVMEPLNVRKELSYVILELHTVKIEPLSMRKK